MRLGSSACCVHHAPVCLQQACEMVMDILRERDQGGFGDRNEYGSRIGGGIDVSVQAFSPGRRAMRCGWGCSSWPGLEPS